jgi:hypothetical protein
MQEKSNPTNELRCYYCGAGVTLNDLLAVDREIKEWDPEEIELIYDQLPRRKQQRESPYIHPADVGYSVINLCDVCWKRAIAQYLSDD